MTISTEPEAPVEAQPTVSIDILAAVLNGVEGASVIIDRDLKKVWNMVIETEELNAEEMRITLRERTPDDTSE